MLKPAVILLLFITFTSLQAQGQETLFDAGKIEHGGYGALTVKFSKINEKLGVIVGGYGGWLINNQFMLGAGGYGLANMIEADPEIQSQAPGKILDIQFGYGGFMFEYIMMPNQLIHTNVKALIGAGSTGYSVRDSFNASDTKQSACFVMEVDGSVEVNVTDYFRFCVGVGYRHVSGNDLKGLKDSDLAGPSGVVTFKFGSF